MALSVSAIRSRVQAQVTADMTGWRASKFAIDLFGRSSRQTKHKSFAIGVGGSEPSPLLQRQRLADGVRVDTSLMVRFAYRVRVDNQLTDYDSALDGEQSIIQAVLATSRTDLHIELGNIATRQVVQEPGTSVAYFLGEVVFRASHRLALAA